MPVPRPVGRHPLGLRGCRCWLRPFRPGAKRGDGFRGQARYDDGAPGHPRMKRRLLNCVTLLSLSLAAGAAALWVRSYFYMESWAVQSRTAAAAWGASRGQIMIERTRANPPFRYDPIDGVSERRRSLPVDLASLRPAGLATDVGVLGFRYLTVRKSEETRRLILVPYWFVVAALLALPARRGLTLARRRLRPPPGCCPVCGYDLRATPGRCPECGEEPSARKAG